MSNIENNNSSVEAIIEGAETGNIDSNSQNPSNNTPSVEERTKCRRDCCCTETGKN